MESQASFVNSFQIKGMNKSTSRAGGIFITENRSFPAALDILSVSAYNTGKQKATVLKVKSRDQKVED